jgi:hypothetical protein
MTRITCSKCRGEISSPAARLCPFCGAPFTRTNRPIQIIGIGVAIVIILAIVVGRDHLNQGTGTKLAVKTQAALTDSSVIIYNLDDFAWPSVMVYLNGTPLDGYRAGPYGPIAAKDQFSIPFGEFVRGDLRFNARERKVQQLIVHVDGYDAPILGFR